MTRRFQFSLKALLEIQGLVGAGLGWMLLTDWLRTPHWWLFTAIMSCAGGCFGAAIGIPAKRPLRFAAFGAGAWFLFFVGVLIYNTFI
jgi:hypothetical protein